MPGDYAMEESAAPRSRLLLHTSSNAPPDDDDTEMNSFSPVTDESDLQRLLVEDGHGEESNHKRPQGWRNSPSWLRSRRPQRLRPLGGRSAGICYACEKLIPKRRKSLRTVLLFGLGTTLALYALDVFLLALSTS